MQADPEQMQAASTLFKELNLTQEQAQKLVLTASLLKPLTTPLTARGLCAAISSSIWKRRWPASWCPES